MCGLDFPDDPNVIVGMKQADDAGVYKITDDIAIIQTVDFFTPIVDDPYWFGQIAAANALSDVYAMGGVPRTALNLVAFPIKKMTLSVLRRMIQGGLDKLREADVVLIGGHSIDDQELKYGLSIMGFVHPDRVLTKKNLRIGDRFILTKPLGTGIINTAIKAGLASPSAIDTVTRQMAALNRNAASIMASYPVHACTDITGFGLLGHLAEMIDDGGPGIELDADRIPVLPEASEYAAMGLVPGGAHKNREFREHMVRFSSSISRVFQDILFDPQTSGGLLISVKADHADDLLHALRSAGIHAAAIGRVVSDPEGLILVR